MDTLPFCSGRGCPLGRDMFFGVGRLGSFALLLTSSGLSFFSAFNIIFIIIIITDDDGDDDDALPSLYGLLCLRGGVSQGAERTVSLRMDVFFRPGTK